MKIYTIHINKKHDSPLETVEFVPETSFNIWAGFFQIFWALYHKMWLCASLLFVAQSSLVAVEKLNLLHPDIALILRFGFFIYLLVSGNDWYRSSLSHRGYELVDVIHANSKIEAQSKFFGTSLSKELVSKEA